MFRQYEELRLYKTDIFNIDKIKVDNISFAEFIMYVLYK